MLWTRGFQATLKAEDSFGVFVSLLSCAGVAKGLSFGCQSSQTGYLPIPDASIATDRCGCDNLGVQQQRRRNARNSHPVIFVCIIFLSFAFYSNFFCLSPLLSCSCFLPMPSSTLLLFPRFILLYILFFTCALAASF